MFQALDEPPFKPLRAGLESVDPEHPDFIVERTGQAVGRLAVDLGHADGRSLCERLGFEVTAVRRPVSEMAWLPACLRSPKPASVVAG